MMSRPVVLALLAAGCVTAAAGGAYVAVRQNANTAMPSGVTPFAAPSSSPATEPGQPAAVASTDAVVAPTTPAAEPVADVEAPRTTSAKSAAPQASPRARKPAERQTTVAARSPRPSDEQSASRTHAPESASNGTDPVASVAPVRPDPVAEPLRLPEVVPATPTREFLELVVPSSSVIGLQMDTSLSSERARVEDRVEARVTRDVLVDGRVAIPAGSRLIGAVTTVERGGKIKERARLGVRFHTLVLADKSELPIRTENITREGEAPGRESSAKIGGAAVGGAILGAILGGGKGAMIGGATGAAGGTAVVMAGDRNAATLNAGTVLTVRLTDPVTVEVEKR